MYAKESGSGGECELCKAQVELEWGKEAEGKMRLVFFLILFDSLAIQPKKHLGGESYQSK